MENYSRDEREDMSTSDDPSTLYFYLYLPLFYNLGVLVPLTSFEIKFLSDSNVSPSHITPNVWGILRDF